MKAIVHHRYGPPDTLLFEDVDTPAVGDDGVLVRVHAASLNAGDWRLMRGEPYFARKLMGGFRAPKRKVIGADVAGRVEAVGSNVTQLKPGDEVYGIGTGTFAEHTRGRERSFAPKPAALTFEQAAAVPVAGLTALQALRDKGRLRRGQKVLITGASGGVGTFGVQIAKALGAHVTAVCSTSNVDRVRSLGADRVIDRTKADFTRGDERYDVIVDVAGDRSVFASRRVLAAGGTLVTVGAPKGRWVGPLARMFEAVVLSRLVRQKLVPFISKSSREDLLFLKELIEAGKVTPVIDRMYPLSETAAAIRHLEEGHPYGKVVIVP